MIAYTIHGQTYPSIPSQITLPDGRLVAFPPGSPDSEWLAFGGIVETLPDPPPPEPGPFRLTQLQLETFLASHGMESAFLAALQSDPAAYHKYLISGDIASDHPLVEAFLPVVAGKMGMTADAAMALLREAAESPQP